MLTGLIDSSPFSLSTDSDRATRAGGLRPLAVISALFLSSFLAVGNAIALTADFESLLHGEVVSGQIAGVTIDALNPNRSFDYAVAFDSTQTNTADADLESNPQGPAYWSGGNLVDTELGIMLIIQENDTGCAVGICSNPDDEGRRPAGDLGFSFEVPVLDFGFDLVDIESIAAESGYLEFFQGQSSAIVQLMDFLELGNDRYDSSIVLGNNTANRYAAITAASVGLENFDRVVLHLGGSGAIDNIQATLVPEPSTALLMALGLCGLALRRRRA